ncbi:uncharacterized protein EAE97_004853 [Botrytis byssoidea]|uniref:Uncharacterized protein n=1 Tax=Botrytis byssoidea TaxID=139641 RepID=A0A9P5M3J9_9HELO|nr:uncharacterized protein EAE97_004853 [Botrytis byssoidea]KAF7945815.1 hypothetical protein EAE97_004853 [Botrytis byssoidea]
MVVVIVAGDTGMMNNLAVQRLDPFNDHEFVISHGTRKSLSVWLALTDDWFYLYHPGTSTEISED